MVKNFVISLMMLSLVGCSTVEGAQKPEPQDEEQHTATCEEEQTIVYSFTGEHEGLSLDNGVIVLTPTQQMVYGGELNNNQDDTSDISKYVMTFAISTDEGKEKFFTTETGTLTESEKENFQLATLIGLDMLKGNIKDKIENNFYLDVTITKANGDEQQHQIKLEATEVTGVKLTD